MEKNTQLGTVLVFRPGTTKEQAEAILATLAPHLDGEYWLGEKPHVSEFNPEYGGPVWYVP